MLFIPAGQKNQTACQKKVSPIKYFFKSTIFPKTLLYQWEYFINTSLQHEPYFFSCVAGEV
jgi:hypothetical protein